jgi:hypothetical protein
MKKELSKKQKVQNVLFILLNSFLVMLGFCFIAMKIEDYKLICLILFSLYCVLGLYFYWNLINLSYMESQKKFEKFKKYYNKKE